MDSKEIIMNYLRNNCKGKSNAIHYKDIQALLRMPSRHFAFVIGELRNEGYPICSHNNYGIWWAETEEEIRATINFHQSRIDVLNANIAGLRKALKQ